ncbi:MAG TPA: hypothetical protein DCX92_14725, partial [Bacteroidetes bacterium]|nr:hypothetical protein [Bacteroidota bacterium]
MLNAFTEDILCPSCYKFNEFDGEEWKNLLEDAMQEAPKMQIGEGQPSTIMRGQYTYQLMYGRQEPRCAKCKTNIDVSKIEEYSAKGKVTCSKCSTEIFVRKSDELIAENFSNVKYLLGEDDDQLRKNPEPGKLPTSAKPVLFTCPSCAGNLEIDGTDRMVSCKFCDSQIYLPDDLWLRLHPVKEVSRWYMLVDENALPPAGKMPEWYYLSDMIADKDGNIYFATANDGENDFMVWSLDKNLNARWIRKDIKFHYEDTRLEIAADGNIYIYNPKRHSLVKISSKDGSPMQKIEGSKDRKKLNMKGCKRLVAYPDGTLLANINHVFARFNEDGERVKLWETKKFGLLSAG